MMNTLCPSVSSGRGLLVGCLAQIPHRAPSIGPVQIPGIGHAVSPLSHLPQIRFLGLSRLLQRRT